MVSGSCKARSVAVALGADEARAVLVLLAALELGEAAVLGAWRRYELPLGRARAALADAVVAAGGGASFETRPSAAPQDEEGGN